MLEQAPRRCRLPCRPRLPWCVSCSERRRQSATTAATAPMTNGMRQPQAFSSASVRNCCSTTSTSTASSWPPISVTYWNEAKKPRCPSQRHLAHVGGRGAVLAAHRQALEQARDQQQRGRQRADRGVGRQAGDQQRAGAHHQHRDQHRGLAAVAVGDAAEQPAADRAHQEAGGEHAGGVQQLAVGSPLGKNAGAK